MEDMFIMLDINDQRDEEDERTFRMRILHKVVDEIKRIKKLESETSEMSPLAKVIKRLIEERHNGENEETLHIIACARSGMRDLLRSLTMSNDGG